MRPKVVFVLLGGLLGLVPAGAQAVTDTRAVAQGNGTLSYGNPVVNCTGPVAVAFTVSSNQAVFIEEWGPGSPGVECVEIAVVPVFASNANPGLQLCTPIGGDTLVRGYALGQSGTTYTLQSSMRTCSGVNELDKIVVTVRSGNITFTHTYSRNGTILIKATGTIPRLA